MSSSDPLPTGRYVSTDDPRNPLAHSDQIHNLLRVRDEIKKRLELFKKEPPDPVKVAETQLAQIEAQLTKLGWKEEEDKPRQDAEGKDLPDVHPPAKGANE